MEGLLIKTVLIGGVIGFALYLVIGMSRRMKPPPLYVFEDLRTGSRLFNLEAEDAVLFEAMNRTYGTASGLDVKTQIRPMTREELREHAG